MLQAVKNDPFASIRELCDDVITRNPRVDVGWWKVFRILRANSLVSRRARFRFARNRS